MEKIYGVVVESCQMKRGNDGWELPEAHSRWVAIDVPHLRDFVTEKKMAKATEGTIELKNTGWACRDDRRMRKGSNELAPHLPSSPQPRVGTSTIPRS